MKKKEIEITVKVFMAYMIMYMAKDNVFARDLNVDGLGRIGM